jgi:DHA1 family multidrug resistance protein-like MFS transporter
MRLSFVIAAGIIFVGTVGVGILVKEPVNNERPSEGSMLDDLKIAFHNRKLVEMLLLLFGAQMISMTLQPLITLYVAELQGNMEGVALTAGIIYSMAGIAGAISAPMWGKLGQKKGFIQILVIAFIGAGIFNMGQFFIVNIYQFSVLQFFFGLFIVGVYPAINTIAVNSTDKAFQGRIFGLTTTANHLGSMVGPLVGGMISSWLGIGPVFLFTGSVLIMIGLLVFFKIPRATGVISKEMK